MTLSWRVARWPSGWRARPTAARPWVRVTLAAGRRVATLGKSLTPTCLEGSPVSSLKCDGWPWSNLEGAVRPWSAPLVETDFASCATGR